MSAAPTLRPRLRTRVLVLGGGPAGVSFCRACRADDVEITLVDRQNHLVLRPLLPQVAAAGMRAGAIARPLRSLFRDRHDLRVRLDEVVALDLARRRVRCATGAEFGYDYLVVALGADAAKPRRTATATHFPAPVTLADALSLRRRLLLAFEHAENEPDPGRMRELLTFAVVGGGETGVALAGAVAEMVRAVLRRDFLRVDPTCARILLAERGPRLLPAFPARLSQEAGRQLRGLGVQLRLGDEAAETGRGEISFAGVPMRVGLAIWTVRTSESPADHLPGLPVGRDGRMRVQPDLSAPGHPEVFVVGDLAAALDADGAPVPGGIGPALRMGRHAGGIAAEEIRSGRLPGEGGRPVFAHRRRGDYAFIGGAGGVARLGRLRLAGRAARLAWLFAHRSLAARFGPALPAIAGAPYPFTGYKSGSMIVLGAETPAR